MSGKLLMFVKLSLKSFIYDLAETFCFPSRPVLEIYKKYRIEKIEMYHVLTDTDSTALQFIIFLTQTVTWLNQNLEILFSKL